MEIEEFIAARLAEDEQIANESGGLSFPVWFASAEPNRPHDGVPVYERGTGSSAVARVRPFGQAAAHIALHDPARELRQIKATRELIALFADNSYAHTAALNDVLLAVASVWADHPDYRPEWAQG